jgi:RES domain-containing protein
LIEGVNEPQEVDMSDATRSAIRHLVMRLALAFALGWFGVQELHNPSDWGVFVPNVIAHHYPHAVNSLVILHGFLLTLASVSVFFGLAYFAGSALAAALLGEVVIGLWLGGGVSDLVIRDIGLFGLAAAVAVDPVRVWHLDELIGARLRAMRTPASRKQGRKGALPSTSGRPAWVTPAASGALLVVAVIGLASVLRVTGSSASAQPPDSSVFTSSHETSTPTDVAAAPTAAASDATPVEAQPTPAQAQSTPANTGTQFATWQYQKDSFQIYPGSVSSDGQTALAGFDLSVEDQGTQVILHLKALSTRYHDAAITVDKANTAYFVETSMRDDPNGQEQELNDDGVVVVDPQGYLIGG